MQVHEIFEELLMSGLQPTAATYNTLITAYASQGAWLNALTALTHMLQKPVRPPFSRSGGMLASTVYRR
jgi:pentatricopeptide repeat protein